VKHTDNQRRYAGDIRLNTKLLVVKITPMIFLTVVYTVVCFVTFV